MWMSPALPHLPHACLPTTHKTTSWFVDKFIAELPENGKHGPATPQGFSG
jgi:hypothetical protein